MGPRNTGTGWDPFPVPLPSTAQAGKAVLGTQGQLPQHGLVCQGTRSHGASAAHHAKKGCCRVVVVGVLVPQHEVMRSIDDDTLEVGQRV